MSNKFEAKKLVVACDRFLTDLISDTQFTKQLRVHVENLRNYTRALISDAPILDYPVFVSLTLDEIGPVAKYYMDVKID